MTPQTPTDRRSTTMNTPAKYRKKPVVVEAMRVTPTNVHEAAAIRAARRGFTHPAD